jgi:hypothetical protein
MKFLEQQQQQHHCHCKFGEMWRMNLGLFVLAKAAVIF